MVDASDLKSDWYLNASAGSSPARGTNPISEMVLGFFMSKIQVQFTGREVYPERSRRKPRPEVQVSISF